MAGLAALKESKAEGSGGKAKVAVVAANDIVDLEFAVV